MKRSILILTVFFLALLANPVFADTNKIEISFKVGDETLKINGKDIQVEKPFVKNGVTLVPLRVITEAFGAEVNWDGGEKSITIKNNERVIILFVNKTKVIVDGKEVSIPEAPVINNSVTMVPLRFITENFGSEVKYDDKTAQINVIKEIAGEKSIKDYALILKKTTKTQVGDSYYCWSMSLPKELKIIDRRFDGTYTEFLSDDESYGLYISIWKSNSETLDTLMAEERENNDHLTLVSQGIENKNGVNYAKIVFKGENVFDTRFYIQGGKVYMVNLFAKDYEKYKDSTAYTSIIDSFRVSFVKDDSIEDLSDINTQGYRSYNDKNLKFSIDVLPDWYESTSKAKPNNVKFYFNDNSTYMDAIYVNMYTRENGLTPETWMNIFLKEMEDEVNPDYYKILKQEDSTINGINCKKVYYTQKIAGSEIYSCDAFLVGENYKYNVYYHIKAETYQDKQKLAAIEKCLNSFKFLEPDSSKVGPLMDPESVTESNIKVKKQNSEYKWSVDLPASWTANRVNNDKNIVFYGKGFTEFQLLVINEVNLDELIPYFEEEINKKQKMGSMKVVKKEVLNEKGTVVYKYSLINILNKLEVIDYAYILNKNGYLYTVDLTCIKEGASAKNIETLEAIWQSMKFE